MKREKLIGTIGYLGGVMSVPEPFSWAWGNMLLYTQEAICQAGQHFHIDRSKLSLHDYARNDLLARMRGDWILMFDTDIVFEPDVAARLIGTMERYGLDVVTGIYSYKKPPHYPVLYLWNQETERNEIIADWPRDSEIFQVDSAGAGCLLVRRRVFERITSELGESPFDRIGRKGEDHSFFERLRRLDIKAWCAWKIEVQHLEYLGIQTSEHFQPTREPDNFYERLGFEAAAELAAAEN